MATKRKTLIAIFIFTILVFIGLGVIDAVSVKHNMVKTERPNKVVSASVENNQAEPHDYLKENEKYLSYLPENALHPITLDNPTVYYEGPSGKEGYYNVDETYVIKHAETLGYTIDDYHVREDGCRMLKDYIICAADYDVHEFGSIVETSLGKAIVLDTGSSLDRNERNFRCDIDLLTTWE